MTSRSGRYRPASGWAVEIARFKALFAKWLDYRLKLFFDLSIRGPAIRRYWTVALGVGFVAAGFVAHAILNYFPVLAPAPTFSLSELPLFFLLTVARLVILLFIPAYLAITLAGNYLADVFELDDPGVAWDFIRELSGGGAREIIHMRDGKISEESLNSPVLLIGGPGLVLAEFDSAGLFERADGTPHVIGPVGAGPEQDGQPNIILDGFERLREPVLNLRDQYIGSMSGQPMTIIGRSLDGIPISATDVRGVFSIRRQKPEDGAGQDAQAPYTFDPADIENLIYKQAVPVINEGPYPSGQPGPWTATMQGLIRGSLSEFMSQHKLGEYLAGIGSLESDLSEYREDSIVSTTLRYSSDLPDSKTATHPSPKFHSRTELIERFTKSTNGFGQRAGDRGLELHWIGVGTWKTPNELASELIKDQHLEAWRLNRDNAERSSPAAAEALVDEAYINEKIRLIQDVPLASHQKNTARYSDKDVLLECLLQDYWEQIGDALDSYYQAGNAPAELETMEKAVLRIERLLKVPRGHVIGGGTMSKVRRETAKAVSDDAPPAPASRFEAEQYRALLGKLDGDYKVAEGMIANEGRRHPGVDRAELIRRIVSRFERHGR